MADQVENRVTSKVDLIQLELYGSLLVIFSIVLLLALISFDRTDVGAGVGVKQVNNILGAVGAHTADVFLWLFGLNSFLLDIGLAFVGIRAILRRPVILDVKTVSWTASLILTTSVILEVVLNRMRPLGHHPSGVIGLYVGEIMIALFSDIGAGLIAGALLALSVIYLANLTIIQVVKAIWKANVFVLRYVFNLLHKVFLAIYKSIISSSMKKEKALNKEIESPPIDVGDTIKETPKFLEEKGDLNTVRHPLPSDLNPVVHVLSNTDKITDVEEGDLQEVKIQPDPLKASDPPQPKENIQTPPPAKIVLHERRPLLVQERLPFTPPQESKYEHPPLSLLDVVIARNTIVDDQMLRKNAAILEKKLLDYKVEGRVVEIHPGPVVTMYEFLPAPGIKISQIASLADDLTMALEAMSIRIVAPIPGKGVVGIEVPNSVRETVYLKEILASEAFVQSKSKLTLALGKDIFGYPVVADLTRMPHLLIAGATGSGKSVAINAFILSLVYNASPDEVRLILVDPKVVELQVYEGIPHLLLPVVFDPKHASAALRWAVEEMERRYELLARFGVKHLETFNEKVEKIIEKRRNGEACVGSEFDNIDFDEDELQKLPYIVIILDEFADLMMVASKEVETAVARLAQKARAAGIHLIMATQRPSKEVITGLIKANFTSRISFRVSSKVDSRIILDQGGAEALLGFGDMLFLRPGNSVLQRVHGPFVSENEVHRVVAHLKAQGEPHYQMEIIQSQTELEEEDPADLDPLFEDALAIVKETRRASISYIQRRLKIGYNRSARIMEQMERKGIVGPPDSRGERQVLI